MALSDAAQRVDSEKDTTCVFGRILRDLPDEDRAYYDQMVAERRTWVFIASVFREDGHQANETSVRKHGTRKCPCR